jgi:glycosyltransferase involved in cell wall biosynthesis
MAARYVLITPLKNEEATIKPVVESVKNQSVFPYAWIIVNDGSRDRSAQILAREVGHDKRIHVLDRPVHEEYNWLGYGDVINEGIDLLNRLTAAGELGSFDYLGLLDSDITLEERYFEKLVNYLASHPDVGVVSGDVLVRDRRGLRSLWTVEFKTKHPRGGARLYNYRIFSEIGGFPRTPSPDWTSDIKIMSRGYRIHKIPAARSFQYRRTLSRGRGLEGFRRSGQGRYILCYNFFHIIAISLRTAVTRKPRFAAGFMLFWGYISGFLTRTKRIRDNDVIRYSRNCFRRILRRMFC